MKASFKINQIESKISQLESQKQLLLEERQKEISTLITALDLCSWEDKLLIGGLQYLKHKVSTRDQIMEDWLAAGERFLLYTKRTQKFKSSKKGSCSQPVYQLPKKTSQPREKKNENSK